MAAPPEGPASSRDQRGEGRGGASPDGRAGRGRRGRPATLIVGAALFLGAALVGVTGASRVLREAPCGAGFARSGLRCCALPGAAGGICAVTAACPAPLVPTPKGCDAPARDLVAIPATTVVIGPSDWEAEGRVPPRTVMTRAFAIARLEVTVGALCEARPSHPTCAAKDDAARAAYGLSLADARAICTHSGGRLPTEDEWLAAAAGDKPRRYPWGDTGAVCRRAAFGLLSGPCGEGATGPDTVGAHPDGATPLGVHDLAGNVAEWVETTACPPHEAACVGVVRGGAWSTALATELRTWMRRELPSTSRESGVGARCAYDAARGSP